MKTNRIVAAVFAMGVLACGILSFAATARAEDAPSNSSVPFWEKTKVTGTFDASYNFNFNNPACPAAGCPAANALRVFDTRHNSFDFNLAEIAIENHPTSWATFRLDLDFGQDVPAVTGLYNFAGSGMFGVQQAYADLTAPWGKGVTFRVGHFVTPLGYEVIESAYNLNFSRSLLFGFAIPFTHTGLTITYPFSDKFTGMIGVVNGWDVVADNNKGKTILYQLTYKPIDKISLSLQGTAGPEQTNTDKNWRAVVDFVGTWTPNDKWIVGLNYDWAHEKGCPGCTGATAWQGGALYVHYKPIDFFGLTLRGEYFSDDGSRTGIAGLKVGEGTLTGHFYMGDGWETRLEFRHDQTNNSTTFLRANGATRKFQDTVATEVVYSF